MLPTLIQFLLLCGTYAVFALLGFAWGTLFGYRFGRKNGFRDGRKTSTYWERRNWVNAIPLEGDALEAEVQRRLALRIAETGIKRRPRAKV